MVKKYEYTLKDIADRIREVSNQVFYLKLQLKNSIRFLAIGLILVLAILIIKLNV